MISAGDFRNGITIELDNNVYQIIEFQHVKPGKGAAIVKTKLKNLTSAGLCTGCGHRRNRYPNETLFTIEYGWRRSLIF